MADVGKAPPGVRRSRRVRAPLWRRYRKKPVVIEARVARSVELIRTLEGTMRADVGDYIIRGVRGEVYPCKPDIFRQTYEPVGVDEDYAQELAEGCGPGEA